MRYLTTLDLPAQWLEELRRAVPGTEIRKLAVERAADIPPAEWAEVDVLHTHSAVPDPGLAPRLRWVQLDTAGIDHLAGHPIWRSEVDVTTLAGVSATPMAEYVTMMTLAHHHHLTALFDGQARHEWQPVAARFARYRPRPTAGRTMVIVGYGRIGREIGRMARALGMHVIGVSRTGAGDPEPGVELAAVDTLTAQARRADVLVLVVPLTAATRALVGGEVLDALPAQALIIDVGRGGVLDHQALRAALEAGRIGGAVLDVFPTEPLPAEDPLWDDPRVIVTPHISGFSPGYHHEVLDLVSDNLQRLHDGRPLRNLVDHGRGY
jgi:phosphoglycerate dehydrogenase-like enzyme